MVCDPAEAGDGASDNQGVVQASGHGKQLSWIAGVASGTLLRAPFESEEGEVTKLDDPGYGVGGYYELVVENRFFVHTFSPVGAGW
jgi:hypothetical protein